VKLAFASARSKRKAHYFGWSIDMPDISEPSSEGKYKGAKTILIVEDDPSIGEFFVEAITEENRHVALLVTSGFEALEIIKEVTPDLFLLDYHLPQMNGIELYDRLHATKGLERVPTIMTSAGVLEHNFQNRHIVGISKPVELNKLLDLIEELLT
jgi:CheY-like chemotaxis protein